jgi:hypothetical protein
MREKLTNVRVSLKSKVSRAKIAHADFGEGNMCLVDRNRIKYDAILIHHSDRKTLYLLISSNTSQLKKYKF